MARDGEKLGRYQAKRDFTRTPEPAGRCWTARSGTAQDGGQRRFVVQRHRARRLHYDLRFEIDGVLVSWAVPNGPTLDPAVKRLAVHVEDHPIEYLDFEGVIPAGEYGGGDVIVWDLGTWEPHETDDPAAAVAAGELHVDVTGHKLRGRLILVRSGGRGSRSRGGTGGEHRGGTAANPAASPSSGCSCTRTTTPRSRAGIRRITRGPSSAGGPTMRCAPTLTGSGGRTCRPTRRRSCCGRPRCRERARTSSTRFPNLAATARGRCTAARCGSPTWTRNCSPVGLDAPDGVTKRELIGYAARIAPVILPYLAGRPLNMHRFPGGVAVPGFWHKQLPDHAPDWVPRWDNPEAERGKTTTYLVVDEPAALVWAANFGALEWHAWTAKTTSPRSPATR